MPANRLTGLCFYTIHIVVQFSQPICRHYHIECSPGDGCYTLASKGLKHAAMQHARTAPCSVQARADLKPGAVGLQLVELRLQLLGLVGVRGLQGLQVSSGRLHAALRLRRRPLRCLTLCSERCGLLRQAGSLCLGPLDVLQAMRCQAGPTQ